VQHIVRIFTNRKAGIQVADVTLDKGVIGFSGKQIHIGLETVGQVIQAAHPVAIPEQRLTQVGADKAGAARDHKQCPLRKYRVILHAYSLQYS